MSTSAIISERSETINSKTRTNPKPCGNMSYNRTTCSLSRACKSSSFSKLFSHRPARSDANDDKEEEVKISALYVFFLKKSVSSGNTHLIHERFPNRLAQDFDIEHLALIYQISKIIFAEVGSHFQATDGGPLCIVRVLQGNGNPLRFQGAVSVVVLHNHPQVKEHLRIKCDSIVIVWTLFRLSLSCFKQLDDKMTKS